MSTARHRALREVMTLHPRLRFVQAIWRADYRLVKEPIEKGDDLNGLSDAPSGSRSRVYKNSVSLPSLFAAGEIFRRWSAA